MKKRCEKCGGLMMVENFVQPITVSYPEWMSAITDSSIPRTDALYLNGTVGKGAVLKGHVRQNAMTAFLPYTPVGDDTPGVPLWSN